MAKEFLHRVSLQLFFMMIRLTGINLRSTWSWIDISPELFKRLGLWDVNPPTFLRVKPDLRPKRPVRRAEPFSVPALFEPRGRRFGRQS